MSAQRKPKFEIIVLMLLMATSIIIGKTNRKIKLHGKGEVKMEYTKTDRNTTEKMVIDAGYTKLSIDELKEKMCDKTVTGDYYNGRKYISYADFDGNIQGVNDLGSHIFGKYVFDIEDSTLSVEWDGYWETWTGYAYEVEGEVQFFDATSKTWRTTFRLFQDGKQPLVLEKK